MLGALALVALSGCASGASAGGGETGGKIQIAYLPLAQANPYTQSTYEGIKEYAAAHNAEVTVFDASLDGAKQQQQCTDVVSNGQYQAIIAIPVTPTNLMTCASDAVAAGIAFVNTDFPVGADASLGKPQVKGQVASVLDPSTDRGDWIFTLLDGACADLDPCEVGLINGTNADPYGTAVQASLQGKAKASGSIQIVQVEEGGYLAGPSLTVAADILQAHPGLDVIVTTSDQMTTGAEQAVADAGRTGEVKLIGGGYSDVATAAIKSGRWYGTYLSLPRDEGSLGAKYALDFLTSNGDSAKTGIGVSASVLSGYPTVITAENIAKFDNFAAQWSGS
jgi:ribose transport system substrate-binding protein